jgi:hypothetical protein
MLLQGVLPIPYLSGSIGISVETYGHMVIERLEQEAAKSEKFVLALSAVWGLEPGTPNFRTLVCAYVEAWICRRQASDSLKKELSTQAKDITDTLLEWIYPGFLPASLISSRLCSMNT